MFRLRYADALQTGSVSEEDAANFEKFIGLTGSPAFTTYILGKQGHLKHLEHHEGYQATVRVLELLGVGFIEFNKRTAMPVEEQFWEQFDIIYNLSEKEMRE